MIAGTGGRGIPVAATPAESASEINRPPFLRPRRGTAPLPVVTRVTVAWQAVPGPARL